MGDRDRDVRENSGVVDSPISSGPRHGEASPSDPARHALAVLRLALDQRDTAWTELREIREALHAHPDEATSDEVRRAVSGPWVPRSLCADGRHKDTQSDLVREAATAAMHVLLCVDAHMEERVEAAKTIAAAIGHPWPPYDRNEATPGTTGKGR